MVITIRLSVDGPMISFGKPAVFTCECTYLDFFWVFISIPATFLELLLLFCPLTVSFTLEKFLVMHSSYTDVWLSLQWLHRSLLWLVKNYIKKVGIMWLRKWVEGALKKYVNLDFVQWWQWNVMFLRSELLQYGHAFFILFFHSIKQFIWK